LRNLTWMISNLCRNKPAPSLALTGPLLEPLNCLLAFDDVATQTDASWAISYITDSGEEHVSAVCAFDRPHSMIQQLMRNGTKDTEDKLLTPTIRALGNVVTGTDQQTQACLENGFLEVVKRLIRHKKKNIVKEIVWAVSNVTAGTLVQATSVIEYGLMPDIIRHLSNSDHKIQKEAAWAVSNLLTTGSVSNINHCIQNGVVAGLDKVLGCNNNEVLKCALDGFTKMLECSNSSNTLDALAQEIEETGALDKIESLQQSENEEVYRAANQIIENYFFDDGYEQQQATTDAQGYYQFNAGENNASATSQFQF